MTTTCTTVNPSDIYVLVTGPYDSSFAGPFADLEVAAAFVAGLSDVLSGNVMSGEEVIANIAEFGAAEISNPSEY